MASYQITNTSTHLVITNGVNVRNINKQLVREVSLLRGTTLKIDIGGGVLRNIFIPIAEITIPVHADGPALLIAINELLSPLEISITESLEHINTTITDIDERVNNMLPASMQEPTFVDESNPNTIYSGFAMGHTTGDRPQWAIMRTTISDEIIKNEWAGGTQQMTSIWDNRTALIYS